MATHEEHDSLGMAVKGPKRGHIRELPWPHFFDDGNIKNKCAFTVLPSFTHNHAPSVFYSCYVAEMLEQTTNREYLIFPLGLLRC